MDDKYTITSEAALEDLIGEPLEFLREKVLDRLDESMTGFIHQSPLLFLATRDNEGRPDVSPKGDPAGFVLVEGGDLIVPERPGNKLTFGFRNILRDDRVGLIFVVPGMRETLRVKGTATLHRDPDVLEKLSVNGKPALMYTRVSVSECFFHCGKAMIRSKLWKPESWETHAGSPMVRQLARTMDGDAEFEKVLEDEVEKNYEEELY